MENDFDLGLEIENEGGRKIDFSSIELKIQKNQVAAIAEDLNENPKLLLLNPGLIITARTEEMVETLLQLPKIEVFKFLPKATQGLQEWNVDRRLSGLEHRQSVMSENYTIQRAIEATFPVLIKRWPNTALRILNKYIQYDGLSAQDPQLTVHLDYSLMIDKQINKQHWISVAKPEHLRYLSRINVDDDTANQLLLHPLVVSFLHLRVVLSWKIPTMKLIFLLLGFAVLSYNVFESYNDRYCSTFESDDSRGTGFWVSQVLFICFFVMDIALAAFQVFVFRLDHVSAILFEVYLIVSIIVGVQTVSSASHIYQVNMMLALFINFAVATTSWSLMGNFMLLTYNVMKTMGRVLLPILFVIMALTATMFFASYRLLAKPFYENDTYLEERCQSNENFRGQFGKWQRDFFWKNFFIVFNYMFGNSNLNEVILDRKDFYDLQNDVNGGLGIEFIVYSVLTGIVLMNLMIGLTIGDVNAWIVNADCKIIQLRLKEEYLEAVWRSTLVKIFGGKFTKRYQKVHPGQIRSIVYPNQIINGCVMRGETGFRSKFERKVTNFYVLGCANVKKMLLQNFSTKGNKDSSESVETAV